MWLMTADTLRMTLAYLSALGRVTALAAGHRQLRVVRQPDVATFAGLVPASMRRAGRLCRVTALTSAVIGERSNEIVRHVATLAVDARVKCRVLVRGLMARAAITGARLRVPKTRMRIVTTHARAG
jgi:hypothetical protein